MHIIDDYVFDSDRLLVYKLDIDKEIIDAIKKIIKRLCLNYRI